MSIRRACAVSYVLQLDDLRRRVETAQLIAGMARAMGNDVPVPDLDEVRAEWEAALCAPPVEVTADPKTLQLKRALGIR